MCHNKPTSVIFGRALVTFVSVTLLLQLTGCTQTRHEADLFSTSQSAPSTEKPVETIAAPTINLQPFPPTPQETPTVQFTGPTPSPRSTSGSVISSPYTGQETRKIKALSPQVIDDLLAGAGTPFGGMAKPAELNGYPGPRHVLDAVEVGDLEVSAQQLKKIESLYEAMRSDAIGIGKEIIELETAVDDTLSQRIITGELLKENILESGRLYGRLRLVHLEAHLSMVAILTPHQVKQYNKLRGYITGNPCDNIPQGHPPELWKKHNNCN